MRDYDDPIAESILRMGPSGGALVLVSTTAHVSSHLESGFDRQRKPGANFGKVKFLGVIPATFTVSFVVLAEEEAAFWADVVPLLRPKGKRGTSPPIDVVNPQINRPGIETVTIVSADIDPPSSRVGRSVTIHLEEWTPAPATAKKDSAAKVKKTPQQLQPEAIQNGQA